MPSQSSAQHRFMEAAAHNPAFARAHSIAQGVAREFVDADKGRHFGVGGSTPSVASMTPYFARQEARELGRPDASGPILSEVPGRTDHIPMSPAANSYVIPADVVAGLAEGNTLGGAAVLDRMFRSEPYGLEPVRGRSGGHSIPRTPSPARESAAESEVHFKSGGKANNPKKRADEAPEGPSDADPRTHYATGGAPKNPVDIIAAGGEYIVRPDVVAKIGRGSIKRGHKVLDKWVVDMRKKHIKDLKKLPGPAKH